MRATLRLRLAVRKDYHIADKNYPITEKLRQCFGGLKFEHHGELSTAKRTRERIGKRTEIVSEKLCDDVIQYLAPSLEPYKGCTLIDVHPGACLWSAKLHEFLKPKRHILMEPDMQYYDLFIKPLLDQPDSTYRHTTLTGAHPISYWDNYRIILDDPDMCSARPALPQNDPKLRELDTSLLLTGNLRRSYRVTKKTLSNEHFRIDMTPLVLQHMTYAALANSILQRHGLVRMLWWASESQKSNVLPPNVRRRRPFDVGLAVGSSVTEIAGVERLELGATAKDKFMRMPELDGSVQARVQRRMDERGQKLPTDREMQPSTTPPPIEDDPHVTDSMFKTTCTSMTQLQTALDDFKDYLNKFTKDLKRLQIMVRSKSPKVRKGMDELMEGLLENVRYRQVISSVGSRASNPYMAGSPGVKARATLLLDLQARLLNLESEYAAVAELQPHAEGLESIRDEILACDEQCASLWEMSSNGARFLKLTLIEDLVSGEAQPSTLERDRRAFDPLGARIDEFWPQHPLMLLDLVPHSADVSAPGVVDGAEGARVLQELCKHLLATPALTVAASLDRLAPNAGQDLLPLVPEMCDARKGGRLNPHKVRVRMMTTEMVRGLVKAFLEWPFRPATHELALQNEWETEEDFDDFDESVDEGHGEE